MTGSMLMAPKALGRGGLSRRRGWFAGRVIGLGVAIGFAVAGTAEAVVTVRIMTSDTVPGGSVPLTVSVEREAEDPAIATTQVDVIFDTAQLVLNGTCADSGAPCVSNGDCGEDSVCEMLCEKSPSLGQQSFFATLPTFQNVEPGERRVRLALLSPIVLPPLPTFEDGVIAICMFDVDPDAATGPIHLRANRLEVGDRESEPIPAVVVIEAGSIVTELPPTATPTATATPDTTPTPDTTQTPDVTPTPDTTQTPEVTPTEPPTATETPTVQPTTPVVAPTNTPTVGVTPVATDTPTVVPPTATPTSVSPTATNTVAPSSPTPVDTTPTVGPTNTPTVFARRFDDDGCAIAPAGANRSGGGLLLLMVPLAVVRIARGRRRA